MEATNFARVGRTRIWIEIGGERWRQVGRLDHLSLMGDVRDAIARALLLGREAGNFVSGGVNYSWAMIG
jgi:hypothetical protein